MGGYSSDPWPLKKSGGGRIVSFEASSSLVDKVCPAVNFGERKGDGVPDILLLHYTGMEDGAGALKWLCCEESGVSCHYLVEEDGQIFQMVEEEKRAHHAGEGSWQGHGDTNSRSIGIEIVNGGHPAGLPDFPKIQMDAVARLSKDIISRHSIAAHLVLAHSDIAPGRKNDPGENFNWQWLASQGIGHWVEPDEIQTGTYFQLGESGEPIGALQSMLVLYGYGLDVSGEYCERTKCVVEAFQRHFRQEKVDGVADRSTISTLYRLLQSLPNST
ncbi:MAG: N-acetylmuramoyl-L-alanine amidase [Rhizobiaceae bacterium]